MFRFSLCVGGLVTAVVLSFLAGCDSSSKTIAVSGKVTYDGQPVEYGTISFGPTAGGPVAGGEINNGQYSVKNVTPGKNIVNITSMQKVSGPMTYEQNRMSPEQMEKNPAATKKAEKQASREMVPANAVGNGATVEITAPNESQNFDLKKPGK